MDLRKLKKLIDLVQESGISELEVTEGEEKVKIVKSGGAGVVYAPPAPVPGITAPLVHGPVAAVAPIAIPGHLVKSPMVGTFYRAPSPDGKPFVDVGATVKEGETVCVIEAMKLMNEIESDVAGKIVKIMVENAKPVEYNQVLFLVDPS